MTPDQQSNIADYRNGLQRYMEAVGRDPRVVMRKEMGKLSTRVIRFTPPKTKSEGNRVVKRDIERAIQPIKSETFKDPAIRKMVREKNYQALQEFASRTSGGRWDIVPFTPELHEKARDRRGRVGKFKGKGLLTADTAELAAYIRKKQRNVGMAKGGWASANTALGMKPPSWVSRWSKQGSFKDALDAPNDAYIKSENESPWAAHGDDKGAVKGAINSRARDVAKAVEKTIERAGKKLK